MTATKSQTKFSVAMGKHTATPWALGRGTVTQIYAVDLNGQEYCSDGGTLDDNHVASVNGIYGNNAVQTQANAEFIVRACNSHDALVEALKEAQHFLKFYSAEEDGYMQRIAKALAAAEVQP